MLVLAVVSSQWLVWGCAEHRGGDTEMVLLLLSRADTEPPSTLGRRLGDMESWEDTAEQVTLTKGIFQTI